MENKLEKYFKNKRLDETRACNIMNAHFLSADGQLVFYEDCLKIAEQIKRETEQRCEKAFVRSCSFYSEPDTCDCIERTHIICSENESECENLKYYRNEYAKLDK